MNRPFKSRESILKAIEDVINELRIKEKDNLEFQRGMMIAFENLKKKLGYEKLIPRK